VQEGKRPNRLDPQNPAYAEETGPSVIVNGFSERPRASHSQRIRPNSENLARSRPRSVPVRLALVNSHQIRSLVSVGDSIPRSTDFVFHVPPPSAPPPDLGGLNPLLQYPLKILLPPESKKQDMTTPVLTSKKFHMRFTFFVAKMFFSATFANVENYLLASMAYDSYAAVCKPLHYATTMTTHSAAGSSVFHGTPPSPYGCGPSVSRVLGRPASPIALLRRSSQRVLRSPIQRVLRSPTQRVLRSSIQKEQEEKIKVFPAPGAGSAGEPGYGPIAKTLNTNGITITKRTRFLLSYPLKPELVQSLQGAGGHTALRIARRREKPW
ncbi:hypothetical protein U0070_026140, partial [Myodes glareolus]